MQARCVQKEPRGELVHNSCKQPALWNLSHLSDPRPCTQSAIICEDSAACILLGNGACQRLDFKAQDWTRLLDRNMPMRVEAAAAAGDHHKAD